jgi:hypothetical protein
MSSAASITFETGTIGVPPDRWKSFCQEHGIEHSPQTVGGNVYYAGQVEATHTRYRLTFSTFHLGNAIPEVARLAMIAWQRWGGEISADPEVRLHLQSAARVQEAPPMQEAVIESEAQLRAVLDQISFAPSCVSMGWQWQIEELRLHAYRHGTPIEWGTFGTLRGWLVNTTFQRPDTNTGKIGTGAGRQELIAYGASETAVVKTCWLLAELIVRHELMEAFLYQGVRIFNPHHSIAELSMPAHARKELP